ncbi:MAG: hypothetical protein DRP15_00395 [Candidatus Aenigmatarchaeota archaeon]|nr:MAG: hypothetical protein DRP15_00395 [Candidatus Aenigmarchaeota archaeon]
MLIVAIPVLLVAAFFIPVMSLRHERFLDRFAVFSLLVAFVFVVLSAKYVIPQGMLVWGMSGWFPPIGIVIAIDALSYLMALLVSGLCLAVGFFSMKYIKKRKGEYYALLLLLTAGMIGLSITGDLFNMYVFLEIVSVACYSLTAWARTKESLEGAFKYIIIGSLGTSFVLIGIALLYGLTGTLTLADISSKISYSLEYFVPIALIVSGFFIKSALVPFYVWKPDAVQASIEPVGGIFSGVSTAVGVYAVLRILFITGLLDFSWILIVFGLASMVFGAIFALVQDDLRRMLAYSSISQIGYIFLALGLGPVGFTAGLFHLFNNALLKVLLFMCAGVVFYHTGVKDLNRLSGLGKSLPITMMCFFIGLLGIIGIPGTNGFVSKFLIYISTWEINPLLTATALIVSGLTLAYYLKAFSCIFLGPTNPRINIKEKTPKTMLVPMIFLAFLSVVIGIYPDIVMILIESAKLSLLNLNGYISTVLSH